MKITHDFSFNFFLYREELFEIFNIDAVLLLKRLSKNSFFGSIKNENN